jgi:hypothetical protein
MRLRPLLLGTDEKEVEYNKDQQERKQLHEKCRTASTTGGSA